MEDLTGKQFGQYQIVGPLGEGGMASVYKAYQAAMERYVAIKVLPKHMSSSDEFAARFRREARMLAQLQHPHILPVFDYGDAEGYPYIVMPYIVSGTLANILHGKRLSLSDVHRILSQVGDALSYAHARGMIHRDIKPSNILIDERGNCLLTDFGLARMAEDSTNITTSGAIMGTPAYMSPEQGAGGDIDHRSDIYSLGIVLYEMVTGRVPYTAETPVAVVFKHIQDPLPSIHKFNPNLPDSIELILRKALAKNPADRYQTAEDFLQALRNAISDISPNNTIAPTSTIPVHLNPIIEKQTSRKWILPAGILLGVGILTVGALWMGRQSSSQSPTSQPSLPAILTTTSIPEAVVTHTPASTSVPDAGTVSVSDNSLEILNDVQILYRDTFDDPSGGGWTMEAGTFENGVMEIIGNENWNGGSRNREFSQYEGVHIDFTYSADSLSEIYFENGAWDTTDYKRFGVYIGSNQAQTNAYNGRTDIGGTKLSGNLTLEPGKSYSLLIAILPNGEFLEVIWNPINSSESMIHREKFDETWAGLPWILYVAVNNGIVQYDNFQEISFSSAK